ncbi:MAG: hypothetical protein ACYDH3_00255 [Candidatus Aminicenantales bacterium]
MAELKFQKATVYKTFKLRTDFIEPPVVTLELTPANGADRQRLAIIRSGFSDDLAKTQGDFEKCVPIIMRHVVGWDLTIKGEAIPCTDENKRAWLEDLLWEIVENEAAPAEMVPDDEAPIEAETWLWARIMGFIGNRENFLKN